MTGCLDKHCLPGRRAPYLHLIYIHRLLSGRPAVHRPYCTPRTRATTTRLPTWRGEHLVFSPSPPHLTSRATSATGTNTYKRRGGLHLSLRADCNMDLVLQVELPFLDMPFRMPVVAARIACQRDTLPFLSQRSVEGRTGRRFCARAGIHGSSSSPRRFPRRLRAPSPALLLTGVIRRMPQNDAYHPLPAFMARRAGRQGEEGGGMDGARHLHAAAACRLPAYLPTLPVYPCLCSPTTSPLPLAANYYHHSTVWYEGWYVVLLRLRTPMRSTSCTAAHFVPGLAAPHLHRLGAVVARDRVLYCAFSPPVRLRFNPIAFYTPFVLY